MKPQVAIIVPVYNVEKYVRRCLESLVSQTLKDLEIICVNDGSTDGSAFVLNEFAQKDARIKVISRVNGGLSAARNTGLDNVTAPFVMFCDSDDAFSPDACRMMYDAIKDGKSDFVRFGVELIRGKESVCPSVRESFFQLQIPEGHVQLSDKIVKILDHCVTNKIYKADLISRYGIRFPVGLVHEDSCFHLKYSMVSRTAMVVEKKLYMYFLRFDGIMSQQGKKVRQSTDYIRIMDDVYEFAIKNSLWATKGTIFLKFFPYFFNIAYHGLPSGCKKDVCCDLALPLLQKIGKCEIVKLTHGASRKALLSILKRKYAFFGKRYFGVGPFKIFKVVSKPSRFEIRVLGIPVWLRRYPDESL